MKNSFWFLLLGVAFCTCATSAASFHVRWVCATEPLTTSTSLIENPSDFELQLQHHNGLDFMPVHEGLITPRDLPEIARQGRVLEKLGARFVILFNKENCSRNETGWTCSKQGPVQVGDLKVKDLWLRLSPRQIKTPFLNDHGHSLRLSFVFENEGFTLPMEYPEGACVFH
jgi:hypothetical protein